MFNKILRGVPALVIFLTLAACGGGGGGSGSASTPGQTSGSPVVTSSIPALVTQTAVAAVALYDMSTAVDKALNLVGFDKLAASNVAATTYTCPNGGTVVVSNTAGTVTLVVNQCSYSAADGPLVYNGTATLKVNPGSTFAANGTCASTCTLQAWASSNNLLFGYGSADTQTVIGGVQLNYAAGVMSVSDGLNNTYGNGSVGGSVDYSLPIANNQMGGSLEWTSGTTPQTTIVAIQGNRTLLSTSAPYPGTVTFSPTAFTGVFQVAGSPMISTALPAMGPGVAVDTAVIPWSLMVGAGTGSATLTSASYAGSATSYTVAAMSAVTLYDMTTAADRMLSIVGFDKLAANNLALTSYPCPNGGTVGVANNGKAMTVNVSQCSLGGADGPLLYNGSFTYVIQSSSGFAASGSCAANCSLYANLSSNNLLFGYGAATAPTVIGGQIQLSYTPTTQNVSVAFNNIYNSGDIGGLLYYNLPVTVDQIPNSLSWNASTNSSTPTVAINGTRLSMSTSVPYVGTVTTSTSGVNAQFSAANSGGTGDTESIPWTLF